MRNLNYVVSYIENHIIKT